MQFRKGKDNYNREFIYLKASKVKGKNWLIKQGFIPLTKYPTPLYLQRDEKLVYYNKLEGNWIISRL